MVKYLGIIVALIKMKYVAGNTCLTSTSGKERVSDTGYTLPPETTQNEIKYVKQGFQILDLTQFKTMIPESRETKKVSHVIAQPRD